MDHILSILAEIVGCYTIGKWLVHIITSVTEKIMDTVMHNEATPNNHEDPPPTLRVISKPAVWEQIIIQPTKDNMTMDEHGNCIINAYCAEVERVNAGVRVIYK